jgi:hypothetical protein
MEPDYRQEAQNWRAIAVYLADCHCGTASYDGALKSVSKSRRKRFRAICRNAAEMLKIGSPVGIRHDYVTPERLELVIERCLANSNEDLQNAKTNPNA